MRTVSFLAMIMVAVSSTPLVRHNATAPTAPAPVSRPEVFKLPPTAPAVPRVATRQHDRLHPHAVAVDPAANR